MKTSKYFSFCYSRPRVFFIQTYNFASDEDTIGAFIEKYHSSTDILLGWPRPCDEPEFLRVKDNKSSYWKFSKHRGKHFEQNGIEFGSRFFHHHFEYLIG